MRNGMRALSLAAASALAVALIGPAAAAAAPGQAAHAGQPVHAGQATTDTFQRSDASTPPPIREDPAPLGANDWDCEPTEENPRPVILAHGFGAPAAGHFSAYSPYLSAKGHCVFTGTYGSVDLPVAGLLGGFKPIEHSAEQLSAFVDKVLEETGAEKVDIVGHSQGGVMPRYYLKNLGGTEKVDNFVAWAAPNDGLTLSGLYTLAQKIPGFEEELLPRVCEVCSQLTNATGFLDELNAGDPAPGDVDYTMVASRSDVLVTPYTTSFLEGDNVDNILMQEEYPGAIIGHIQMAYDPRVWKVTDRALQHD
ncbi:alpha/beta fold hydrolase [Haloechinothrix sp. LS1_15]|uniref:esterase/lipase family protein n=1 Tax=Haloechinothrix sp. LS1_15 TaxID=2652248 RepID=UPI00294534F2|nr:alpha/beta fold hydrolase [Haloechinothrix sp. LS1_15]MDV6010940.1 lipase [Haloechinothrix sp. LS1_15]